MINLLDYFHVSLTWKDDCPKIKLTLKEDVKITKIPLFRSDGRPYSGVTKEYHIHYLGDIGEHVHNERKKICSKHALVRWYISNIDCSDDVVNRLNEYLNSISLKYTKALLNRYNGEFGEENRKKQSETIQRVSHIIAMKNSEHWKDPEFRDRQIQRRKDLGTYNIISEKCKKRYSDPEFKTWFIEQVNKPERIEKIRKHSIKMWKEFKEGKSDRYKEVIKSGSTKKFELCGQKMNLIEYLIGSLLNEMNINWISQKVFKFGSKWYISDFYLSDYNLVIECYGDYWHVNPKYFAENDLIHSSKKAFEFWEYDSIKKMNFLNSNYKFLILWENEIKTNIEYCKQQILNKIDEKK